MESDDIQQSPYNRSANRSTSEDEPATDDSISLGLPPPLRKKLQSLATTITEVHKVTRKLTEDVESKIPKCVTKVECMGALSDKADRSDVDKLRKDYKEELERYRLESDEREQALKNWVLELMGGMQKQIDAQGVRLSEAERKQKEAEAELAAMKGEMQLVKEQQQNMQEENEKVKNQLADAQSQLGTVHAALSKVQEEADRLQQQVTSQQDALEQQRQMMQEQSDAMKKMQEQQDASLASLARQLEEQKRAADEQLQQLLLQQQQQAEAHAKFVEEAKLQLREVSTQVSEADLHATTAMEEFRSKLMDDLMGEIHRLMKQEADRITDKMNTIVSTERERVDGLIKSIQEAKRAALEVGADMEQLERQLREVIKDKHGELLQLQEDLRRLIEELRKKVDALQPQDEMEQIIRKKVNRDLQSHLHSDFTMLGLMLPVRPETLSYLENMDWIDFSHALWTQIGKGDDSVGMQNVSLEKQPLPKSFEPLSSMEVNVGRRCLSCNQPLDPYLILTPNSDGPPQVPIARPPSSLSSMSVAQQQQARNPSPNRAKQNFASSVSSARGRSSPFMEPHLSPRSPIPRAPSRTMNEAINSAFVPPSPRATNLTATTSSSSMMSSQSQSVRRVNSGVSAISNQQRVSLRKSSMNSLQ